MGLGVSRVATNLALVLCALVRVGARFQSVAMPALEDAASSPESYDDLAWSAPSTEPHAPQMPAAPIRPTKFVFHGDSRIDKYQWLANNASTDPAVMQYIDAENAYTSQVLSDTLGMQTDFATLHMLRLNQKAQKSPLHSSPKYLYFVEQRQNANYASVVRKPAPPDDAAPAAESLEPLEESFETVIDFQQESEGYTYFNVMDLKISPDDHMIAYILDTTGNENGKLFLYNMTSRAHYLKPPTESVCSNMVFSDAGDHFWYTKQTEHPRCNQLYHHAFGTDPAGDSLVFAAATPESTIQLARGNSYVLIVAVMPDMSEFFVIDQGNLDSGVVRLLPGEPDISYTVEEQAIGLIIRRDDASEGTTETRVAMQAELEGLRRGHELRYSSLPTLFPKQMGVEVLQSVAAPQHYITLELRQGCAEVAIRRVQTDPEWKEFSEPDVLHVGDCLSDANLEMTANERNESVLVVRGSSATLPAYKMELNLETMEADLTNTIILSDYDPQNYTTERVAALSWDGKRIPVSLLYRTDRVLKDGTAPLLLQTYGAYGAISRTRFSKYNIDLADQGFVVAQAHVRGGGALGLQWHRSGWRMNKMNTMKDTISAIDYLVGKNYTSHQRIALMGRSAGGLPVTAIANLAPTKVGAIVAEVPFLDCLTKLLNSSQPGVVENQVEFGDPRANRTVYDYIQSYSPYDNIKREANFPHILVSTHLNDARIPFWEPAKYVAKLREYKANGNMVLLRVKPGGHLGQSGSHAEAAARRETAAFLFKALNVEYDPNQAHELLTEFDADTIYTSTS